MSHATLPLAQPTRRRFITQCLGGLALAPALARAQAETRQRRISLKEAKLWTVRGYRYLEFRIGFAGDFKSFRESNGEFWIRGGQYWLKAPTDEPLKIWIVWVHQAHSGTPVYTLNPPTTLYQNVVNPHANENIASFWAKPVAGPDYSIDVEFGVHKSKMS